MSKRNRRSQKNDETLVDIVEVKDQAQDWFEDNQNLVVVDAPGQQAHRHIGLVWRPSSSRVNTFNQLADVVSELL